MASHPPQHETGSTSPDIQTFATSLQLLPDGESRVLEILAEWPKLNTTVDDADFDNQMLSFRINAGCQISREVLGESALLEKAAVQQAVSESWSQTCWEVPVCIVQPKSTSQVSKALNIITFLRLPFAIRSGGHSPNPGWSSLERGILIDLSKLDSMSISRDRETFSVGPGVRWGQVYEFLDPYDVTVVGGRIPQVGVGGLLLGGGISYWTGEYGLACDNVANFEVVLSDGSIVNANVQERSDLFWALKGGGPNFGIVTRFDLHTIPVKNIWYQLNIHSLDQAPILLEAFAQWQRSADNKGTVALIFSQTSITVGLIYSQPIEKPETFSAFYAIPPLAPAVPPTIGTVLSLNMLSGGITAPAPRHDYRAASSKIDPDLYKAVYSTWQKTATAVHAATNATSTFVLQHIPKNVVDIANTNGGNPLGLEPTSQQWWTTLIDWDTSAHDTTARSIGTTTSAAWKQEGTKRGSHLPFLYMNDASRDQSPLSTYPAANVEKLKCVANKYDECGVFQTLQNGGFLLGKV